MVGQQQSNFADFLNKPVGSAISDLLNDSPKRVDRPLVEELVDAVDAVAPENPFTKAIRSLTESDPEDEEYVPLTVDEIKIKAQSKTQLWAAGIAMGVSLLNKWVAQQHLRGGDQALIDDYEDTLQSTGNYPIYGPNHPYHAARKRYDKYEEQLGRVEGEAMLTDDQKDMMQKAIMADMRARNKRGQLDQAGFVMTLLEVGGTKAIEPLSGLFMMMMNRGNK